MKILITGAKGFIGKNLIAELRNQGFNDLLEFDTDTPAGKLDVFTKDASFVIHLAGINRPQSEDEFMTGNYGFTSELLDSLTKNNSKAPVLVSSSIQAELNNPYGKSKKAGEDILFSYGASLGISVYVYRLPNVFGKWCKPNYNSAVATFCNNIAHDLPIQINDPNVEMTLVYIDDVVKSFIDIIKNGGDRNNQYQHIEPAYHVKLGEIARFIQLFKNSRETLMIPDLSNPFVKKLYSTYLSYLPVDKFSYPLKMNVDHRGSFTEFIKTSNFGQVSVNISGQGITKGNHWHHTKNEKFLVVKGKAAIRFRNINSQDIIEYIVSGDVLEVVDIPVGYTHQIENIGEGDLITIMWANELFDVNNPDTFFLNL